MLPVKSIVTIDRSSEKPVYLQIANALIREIKMGRISPGERLPGTRNLSNMLDIHRNTAVSAYDELAAQGWIETRASKGTFVKTCIPDVAPRSLLSSESQPAMAPGAGYEISALPFEPRLYTEAPDGLLVFNDGTPDVRLTPTDALAKAYRRVMQRNLKLSYGHETGERHTRALFSDYLNKSRGLQTRPENLIITRGSQMALYLAISSIVDRGDHVVMARHSYHNVAHAFHWTGAVVHRVAIDQDGIDVDEIEQLCKRKNIKAVYVIPHHQYPTTVSLRPERRVHLLKLAETYDFAIIEDDHDFDFHYKSSPILPLASSDFHGRVIYTGSFSKTIAPAFRIGFMAAPADVIEKARKLRRIIDRQGDQVLERALAELIQEGEVQRHLRKALKVYNRRRDYLCQLLKEKLDNQLSFRIPDGGMALWIRFLNEVSPGELCSKLKDKGLLLPTDSFYPLDMDATYAMRIGFASLNREEISRAVDILEDTLCRR